MANNDGAKRQRGNDLDNVDRQLLTHLQEDGRMSNAELARRVGMAPSAVFERLRRLEERKVIVRYEARVDAKAAGVGLTAFIFVRAEELGRDARIGSAMAKIPEVQEVHHVAGEDCYLVKVRTADTESLGNLLRDRFASVPGIRSTRTTIVLGTLKETTQLPLAAEAPDT